MAEKGVLILRKGLMNKRWLTFLVSLLMTALILMTASWVGVAQDNSIPPQSPPPSSQTESTVSFNGEPLFVIKRSLGSTSAQERSQGTSLRITEFADNYDQSLDSLAVVSADTQGAQLTAVVASNNLITFISEEDAKAAGKTRSELANDYLQQIRRAVEHYREERSLRRLLRSALYAATATIIFLIAFAISNKLFHFLHRYVRAWRQAHLPTIHLGTLELINAHQLDRLGWLIARLIQAVLVFGLLAVYLPYVFNLFPQTKLWAQALQKILSNTVKDIGQAVVGYFPKLLVIVFILTMTYFVLRFVRFVFAQLESGQVTLPGFYPEWVRPTRNLVTLLILAVAVTVILPYFPGFGSASFQAISLLIGALVTLGSATIISNLIGGFVIIYTRGFQIGDRIQVGEFVGIVQEKTILSTRIKTPTNEIVTIPNSTIISSNIVNYSSSLRDIQEPLILHTTITLGYDTPWRKVNQALEDAALATQYVLPDPAPYVLQTSLDDFYVSYELRAYTQHPDLLPKIYSELHQNIQDICNEVGIEIMSPHYSSLRDGNQSTIPASYWPPGYTPKGFQIQPPNDFLTSPDNSKQE